MTERKTGRLPQAFAKSVAAELNGLMDDAGLTGQRLAELLDRSVGYVSERRNGKAAWTLDDIDVIAEQLEKDGLTLLRELAQQVESGPSNVSELAVKKKVAKPVKDAARKDHKPRQGE